uniref:Uncharacterized protein n=1 Tax=Candidatus Kentrum sp. TUN TaxID=2126343 RepID=A0A451A7N5_9GAMM|nr:MAG: hypothetical protein BECKTUN1418F_GA0071002_105015 [Candidatus Kentron sp. TUN]VFK59307.1 MAG: hypothetical protein BECKTUN1418E_GA0071001_10533 [Candidatus Kentron sp. TUN]VFK62042.1 MAG: hypothetical protein BECKTUN1418D_GA0071000_11673 [Candidatus Kentron sp. TUN]
MMRNVYHHERFSNKDTSGSRISRRHLGCRIFNQIQRGLNNLGISDDRADCLSSGRHSGCVVFIDVDMALPVDLDLDAIRQLSKRNSPLIS